MTAAIGRGIAWSSPLMLTIGFVVLTLMGVACVAGVFAIDIVSGLFTDGLWLGLLVASAAGYGAGVTGWLTKSVTLRNGVMRASRPHALDSNEEHEGETPSSRGSSLDYERKPTTRQDRDAIEYGPTADVLAPLRRVTAVAVGLGVTSLLTLGVGMAGRLNRVTACALLSVGVVLLILRLKGRRDVISLHTLTAPSSAANAFWFALVPAVSVLLLAASVMPGILWKPFDPHPYDVLSYHLQLPREWYERGVIGPLRHNAFSFFPLLVETLDYLLMHLAGGPWKGMYATQLLSVVFTGLTTLGVAGAVRCVTRSRTAAFAGAALTLTVPWTLMLGSVAYVEAALMCYTALAMAWAVVALRSSATELPSESSQSASMTSRDRPPSRLAATRVYVLVGLLCGFASGVKYTAVPMIAGALAVAFFSGNPSRKGLVGVLFIAVVSAATFAPWALRTWAWTGNPVFPLATSVFGKGHFADDQVERYRRAHAPSPDIQALTPRADAAVTRTFGDWQFGYVFLPLGLFAAAHVAIRGGAAGRMIGVFVSVNLLVWFFGTHVVPRFVTHLIPVFGIALGWALGNVITRLKCALRRKLAVVASAGAVVVALGQTSLVLRLLIDLMPARNAGLWRLADVSALEPEELSALRPLDPPLFLVGDAQPFWRTFNATRTTYRTVFDVVIPPGKDAADGWLGEDIDALRRRGAVIVSGDELQRLSRTYYGIPEPDPKWITGQGPTVLQPTN